MSDTPEPPSTPESSVPDESGSVALQPLQDEMERSFLDYAMSVITSRASARRARRPQAGAPSHHLGHGRARLPPRSTVREVGARQRRHDGQVPPARRRRDLRRAGAHGPALLAAPSADRLPRQLRLTRLRSGRVALHRVPSAPAGDAAARRHRRRDRRHAGRRTTAAGSSPPSCRLASRTCSSTAARASPSAWPPTSRRTTSAKSSTPPFT